MKRIDSAPGAEDAAPLMDLSSLTAISSVDGRYAGKTAVLRDYFSEFGLIRYRVLVEVRWFLALAGRPEMPEFPQLSDAARGLLEDIVAGFGPGDAQRVKEIEAGTNHDVKAVEYYLAERFGALDELQGLTGFLHFACTSEDISNLAYALTIRDARDRVLAPLYEEIAAVLDRLAKEHADLPMLSRTHGQAATPTTLGKEMANFARRLHRQAAQVGAQPILGKFNGAVGNFNAHIAANPDLDWPRLSADFVHALGLETNPYTTQIEPHDWLAELFHAMSRCHVVMLDLCRDIWGYVSLGYFHQKTAEGEVGSSTMPHKVNPIDFENAEGNLGAANALLTHLAEKLPVSRWQRDLSDSTALRTIGTAFGHSLIACRSLLKGLDRLEANPARLAADLEQAWEVLAEPIQTVMRRYGLESPYEQLKALTRGKAITREQLVEFIAGLDIPEPAREALLALSPGTYLGNAADMARQSGD
jgi:adenylosuccinate lyase